MWWLKSPRRFAPADCTRFQKGVTEVHANSRVPFVMKVDRKIVDISCLAGVSGLGDLCPVAVWCQLSGAGSEMESQV